MTRKSKPLRKKRAAQKIIDGLKDVIAGRGKFTRYKVQTIFGVMRDGEIYFAWPQKKDALTECSIHRPGSKHRWSVQPLTVSYPATRKGNRK